MTEAASNQDPATQAQVPAVTAETMALVPPQAEENVPAATTQQWPTDATNTTGEAATPTPAPAAANVTPDNNQSAAPVTQAPAQPTTNGEQVGNNASAPTPAPTATAPPATTFAAKPEKSVAPKTYNVFVGDLEYNATEEDLHIVFDPCGDVHQINIISDRATGLCKGYGFVHFLSREAQMRAMQPPFNGAVIKGRPCKVKKSEQKTVLFVGNLPIEMNQEEVQQAIGALTQRVVETSRFSLELKQGPPPELKSRGFCFITYDSHEIADACKKILYESFLKGRQLNVSWAETNTVMREVDPHVMRKVKTLYVSSISTCVKDDMLRSLFAQFGEVAKSVIVKNPATSESRGFAFVEYAERAPAVAAMKCLNQQNFCGQRLNIVLAKPQPAEAEKKRRVRGAPRGTFRTGTTMRGPATPAYSQWGQQPRGGGWGQQQWGQQRAYGYPQGGYAQQAAAYQPAYAQHPAYAQQAAYAQPAYPQQAQQAAAYGYGQQYAQQNYYQQYQQPPQQPSYGYQ